MPETVVDNPTPAPAAPPPAVPAPATPVAAAKHSADIRSAAQAALDSQRGKEQPKPVTDKPVVETKTEPEKEFPRLTTPDPPKKETPAFDPAKLPPELQESYKLMQADYTRKTQELADGRKALLEEREKFLERALARLEPPKAGEPPPEDPREQIRQLREEGRHDEADQLLIDLTNKAAEERIAPIERSAEIANRKALFRDTLTDVMMNDKVASVYKTEVAQAFDSQHPVMEAIRAEALKTPERIQTWVPAIIHFLAVEQHAMRMEKEFDSRLEAEVTKRVAALKAHAATVPARLVEAGAESKVTEGPVSGSLREVVKHSLAQLTGG